MQWDRSLFKDKRYKRKSKGTSLDDSRFQLLNFHSSERLRRSYSQEDEGWMVLENVPSSDNGVLYTCTVSGPNGEMAKRSVEIVVMVPPTLDELTFGTNIKEGEIAKVICSVKIGDVPVFFSWLKDGVSITANLKIEERNLDLFSILLIRNVGLQHCGVYTCIAANHAGRVNQTAELFIKGIVGTYCLLNS